MDAIKQVNVCARLLEIYGVSQNINAGEVKDFKVYKSRLYGMANIYSFDFENIHYYATDDYSLMDKPEFVENVLRDAFPDLKGELLQNPATQSDGAIYVCGFDGTEYYLWESPIG